MTKTIRMMRENISLVDVVIELLDARIPLSSKNPDIDTLASNKFRVVILNKCDLADDNITKKWTEFFIQKGFSVILANSVSGSGLNEIYHACAKLMSEKIARLKAKGRIFVPIRAMIVGIPNVGKSTLINKIVGKSMAKTGDKPGVTKGKQWIKIKKDFELLDTPGILWHKFDDLEVGMNLAFTGAINDNILDIYTLAIRLIEKLFVCNSTCLKNRYNINVINTDSSESVLEKIAVSRGFLQKGATPDLERAAVILLDEFRGCKLGRISLESPPEALEKDEPLC